MTTILSDIEVRVLGCLVEKQVTTPEYYPLTLNALTLACNQKNNRNPVTSYTETEVSQALETLREKNLTYVFHGSTSRVPKYKHVMPEVMHLSKPQMAVMCVLMLRGPATVGELRGHGARLYEFSGLDEVEETLNSLVSREPESLIMRLPRQPGQKEARVAHLLSGEVSIDSLPDETLSSRSRSRVDSQSDRVGALETEVENLKTQVAQLREQFDGFKKQFE